MDLPVRRGTGAAHISLELKSGSRSSRRLPIHCPCCGEALELAVGLCGHGLVTAILLQAERVGTELDCQHCGHRFIYHRIEQEEGLHLPRGTDLFDGVTEVIERGPV